MLRVNAAYHTTQPYIIDFFRVFDTIRSVILPEVCKYERTVLQTDTKRLRRDQTDADFINKSNERKERIERYNPDKSGIVRKAIYI